jgi:hypothetical protein
MLSSDNSRLAGDWSSISRTADETKRRVSPVACSPRRARSSSSTVSNISGRLKN